MQTKLLEVLACPKCLSELACIESVIASDGAIEGGILECCRCAKRFPIREGIPRFVESDNYTQSFGYQWNRFRAEQIDSLNGTKLSEKRFYRETGWTTAWLKGKWILDAGCGAGRFLDVASQHGAEVVGIDLSNAVDAAAKNLAGRANVHFVQASIYELPFRDAAFDGCYCIGVVQHTPDPQRTLRTLPRLLHDGGRIAVTAYERKPWTKLHAKYWVRPVTKRLRKETLLSAVEKTMLFLFPLTNFLFRLPVAGRILKFVIPIANYVDEPSLTATQRFDWAILDTFDMLSPQYDLPRTENEVEQALRSQHMVNIRRLATPGLTMVAEKRNG